MTVVNLSGVKNNYGIRLHTGYINGAEVEQVEFISPTTSVFKAPTLKGIRVGSVYEFVGGVWTLRTDVRISGDNILLDTAPANQLMIVPKAPLGLVQAGGTLGTPVQLFVRSFPEFIVENFTITTYDTETAGVGPFEFSLTELGAYSETLGPVSLPSSIWIRSKASVVGEIKTIPIVVTADIYL